ncbi:peptidase M19 [Roseiconus nitratireducens]|uniref:Peptidase M19 n=1 Tax=Roseiconus nitratireducens TaxID=2605748 RepID=A0A5M6CVZ3_9BACT|nr:membrane dipeptidase [Roseiconus nitratireducens]KAA5539407.1 peptidase M19 [Roseiconus nitratireducens]
MLVFDAHLDLSLNAITYNRDLRQSLNHLRREEMGMEDLGGRQRATVCFPEMRKAGVGICVATQLAGCMKPAAAGGGWNSPEQAWAMTRGQLAWYQAMEQAGELRQIRNRAQLRNHLSQWDADPDSTPIGYVLSLEGADSLRTIGDLQDSYEHGLRALGPAHYGVGRYALGHDQSGPLSSLGRSLLAEMDQLGVILDVTHLCEPTFWEALDAFEGPVWASHHNCRALVDDPRQLSDRQIKALAARDAVIGVACDVWMIVPNWQRGVSNHQNRPGADLNSLADHVDHVCQLLGSVRHTGIGTDLDGGYGTEQTPHDLKSIADLTRFISILRNRGYTDEDLERICHRNFVEALERAWVD